MQQQIGYVLPDALPVAGRPRYLFFSVACLRMRSLRNTKIVYNLPLSSLVQNRRAPPSFLRTSFSISEITTIPFVKYSSKSTLRGVHGIFKEQTQTFPSLYFGNEHRRHKSFPPKCPKFNSSTRDPVSHMIHCVLIMWSDITRSGSYVRWIERNMQGNMNNLAYVHGATSTRAPTYVHVPFH